ncbi:hypothetical protein RhiirA5_427891 [Rhizophagus irregularis]|uniref:Uncharacterized protein n=1 Tax=Rhizophagus irregularis TaxID=588596 RepID=A0A2I1EIL1_9GLOM|nr:hypothetical protein RhiirA5_439859 [Rhizophagus irregularis]PKC00624.1 hypothetical protein RhiirA5_427891 [Rhizophagus irregularis]PKC75877.1 hypothetical protein RhiirA1_448259 [Rhizophagus irregularis]PKY21973.1 hypothetical protein RhiirB3_435735 [Rhizophagus irregularis]CAB4482411.1 unnamed protein product [Rhizophagus irregularis]
MEWEKITVEVVQTVAMKTGINTEEQYIMDELDTEYYLIGEEIIKAAEKNEPIRKFTALNDDFTKRLKDENKSVDEKNLNEKRLKISPPAKNSKPLENQE